MSEETLRSVSLRRTGPKQLVATNAQGVELAFGSGGKEAFTPIELLLAAIAGCSALDVEALVTRRAEPESFAATITAHKIRDEEGNYLRDLELTFRIAFPEGEAGDAAREVLPVAVQRSHDRLCTVTRTVERSTPVTSRTE